MVKHEPELHRPMAPMMAPIAHRHRARMLVEHEKSAFDQVKHWRTRRDSNPQPSDP